MTWQPIETAPRDGSPFIAKGGEMGGVVLTMQQAADEIDRLRKENERLRIMVQTRDQENDKLRVLSRCF